MGKGDLEKSRFDWVFLNVGLPLQVVTKHLRTFVFAQKQIKCSGPPNVLVKNCLVGSLILAKSNKLILFTQCGEKEIYFKYKL